jgi:hypothetical protein
MNQVSNTSENTSEPWRKAIGGFMVCDAAELARILPMCALELNADVHTVDVRTATDVEQAMMILSQRLRFPDYFGQNLDALYDMTGECADIAQGRLDIQIDAVPHIWLIGSTTDQADILSPVLEAMRDAMDGFNGTALSILWVVL